MNAQKNCTTWPPPPLGAGRHWRSRDPRRSSSRAGAGTPAGGVALPATAGPRRQARAPYSSTSLRVRPAARRARPTCRCGAARSRRARGGGARVRVAGSRTDGGFELLVKRYAEWGGRPPTARSRGARRRCVARTGRRARCRTTCTSCGRAGRRVLQHIHANVKIITRSAARPREPHRGRHGHRADGPGARSCSRPRATRRRSCSCTATATCPTSCCASSTSGRSSTRVLQARVLRRLALGQRARRQAESTREGAVRRAGAPELGMSRRAAARASPRERLGRPARHRGAWVSPSRSTLTFVCGRGVTTRRRASNSPRDRACRCGIHGGPA